MEFIAQPVEHISPGCRFAQVAWRPLGLLTFRSNAILSMPATLSMSEPLQEVRSGVALCVDYPSRMEPQTLLEMKAFAEGGWEITEPRRSPASQRRSPRLRLTLSTGAANCSLMDAAILVQRLTQQLRGLGGTAARLDIMFDDTALVLRGGGPADYFEITPEQLFKMYRPR